MKRILLIEDGRPFWPRIRDLLAKVNASVVEVRPEDPLPTGPGARPDLVIIGDTAFAARPPGWWDGALLILEKGRSPDLVTPRGEGEQQMVASSSIAARTLLTLTSRLLGVSERRMFRAVIGVRRPGQAHVHMGASREFSLTGLSFSLETELPLDERVLISFFIPSARHRMSMEAEVIRSFMEPEDGSTCYGARFVGISSEEQDVLKQFVWGEA